MASRAGTDVLSWPATAPTHVPTLAFATVVTVAMLGVMAAALRAELVRQRVPLDEVAARKRKRDEELQRRITACEAARRSLDTKRKKITSNRGTKKSALVLGFQEICKDDADLVGGKGAHLGELASAGLPVPAGFCVTSSAFASAHQGSQDQRARVRQAIEEAYKALEGGNAVVAVRSSATCEDAEAASFAGQLESYLGLRGMDQIWPAVLKCWDSLTAQRVEAYTRALGSASGNGTIACCVVIQIMVDATSAGVLFTANPVTGSRDEAVVTSSWGLGEAVVGDLVTPDSWIVDRASLDVKMSVISTEKSRMHVIDRSSYAGSKIVKVQPKERREAASLSEEDVRELVRLGNRVQDLYDSPRDIEWAIQDTLQASLSSLPSSSSSSSSSSSRLFLLQARPVTTYLQGDEKDSQDDAPSMNEFDSTCRSGDWVTTCNAREMFPGAGTPLSISTFGRAANFALQAMHFSFGVRDDIDEKEGVVAWFHGCQFLNMTNTLRRMCGGMVGASLAKENGEMSILGRINTKCSVEDIVAVNMPRYASLGRQLVNGMRYVATSLLAVPLRVPRLRTRLAEVRARQLGADDVHETSPFRDDPAALWAAIDSEMPQYLAQWADGVTVSSVSAAFMLAVMKLLCLGAPTMTAWSTEAVAEVSCLIASAGSQEDVAESCDAVQSLDAVADFLVSDPKLARSYIEMDPHDLLGPLRASCDPFVQLLERHGHRCIKEAEMRTLEWAEDPLPLIRQIQASVRARLQASCAGDPTKMKMKIAPSVNEVLVRNKHLWAPQRWLLRRAAALARAGVRNRELGKSLCVAFHTELKRGYRRLGKQLTSRGRLPDADLVFFFTHDELGILAQSPCGMEEEMARMRLRAIQRRRLLPAQERLTFKDLHQGKPMPDADAAIGERGGDEGSDTDIKALTGTPVCTGIAQGPARVVRTLAEAQSMQAGEILICPQTDVGWTPMLRMDGAKGTVEVVDNADT
ncbi:Pyruvate, phosphate dikinase [Hondaea fermentalgiana]|uniref:Pyruvate, phosphate dikinase n=1 Tax=Hondaea fermentalgiana TaxID=2315210 RepID=A0A2R5GV12_9STRA|nr:Pyruvate, phosphate dikinase [Hondaea fermentalgiana]|eukprot:GBG32493.1 Pyruvate, phosphate dikinase [Hondaea fermentalgiana]